MAHLNMSGESDVDLRQRNKGLQKMIRHIVESPAHVNATCVPYVHSLGTCDRAIRDAVDHIVPHMLRGVGRHHNISCHQQAALI